MATEMEVQREGVEVTKHLEGDGAGGALADAGEKRVAELPEAERQHPRHPVGEDEPHRQSDPERDVRTAERIDRTPEEHRHEDEGDLGAHEHRERQHHPGAHPPLPAGHR